MRLALIIRNPTESYGPWLECNPNLVLVKAGSTIPQDLPVVFESPVASGPIELQIRLNEFPEARVALFRHLWPGYVFLKKNLQSQLNQGLHFEYTGNLWGLTHHGAHYVHLFRWLAGSRRIKPFRTQIAEVESKYIGAKEYVGEMHFKLDDLHEIHLYSNDSSGGYGVFEKSQIFIKTKNELLYKVEEVAGKIYSAEGKTQALNPFWSLPHFEQLPTLAEAVPDHRAIFEALALAIGQKDNYEIG